MHHCGIVAKVIVRGVDEGRSRADVTSCCLHHLACHSERCGQVLLHHRVIRLGKTKLKRIPVGRSHALDWRVVIESDAGLAGRVDSSSSPREGLCQ